MAKKQTCDNWLAKLCVRQFNDFWLKFAHINAKKRHVWYLLQTKM